MSLNSLDKLIETLNYYNMAAQYLYTHLWETILIVDNKIYTHTKTLINTNEENTRVWELSYVTFSSLLRRPYGKSLEFKPVS